ncbi:MAG: hypothetical protein RMJ43_14080 [Chloroherpetonaceae bacterium]|nr:hypothetical protein [Chthonomonadaceae bacterium]MDW8208958.1 hypothetical protein [Chloroherpetonaceae bacterium]
MKLSIRLSNAVLVSLIGLLVALLLFKSPCAYHSSLPAVPTGSERVVARELILVDSAGRTRARLGLDANDAPSLQLFDRNGTRRAMFRLNQDDVPSLRLYNAEGKLDSVLGYNLNTMDPALVFFDASGYGRLVSLPGGVLLNDDVFQDADLFPHQKSRSIYLHWPGAPRPTFAPSRSGHEHPTIPNNY